MLKRLFFLLPFLGLIAGCTPLVPQTPPPAPQPIQVFYTPTLQPWMEILHNCALAQPEMALITQETSATNLEFSAGDMTLGFGEPPEGIPGYAAALSTDEIIIIAGRAVTLPNLNRAQLRTLYGSKSPVYQIWTYNEGHELRSIFDQAVLGETAVSSYTWLAPDPAAMLAEVTADPMAIGYLPKSWLTAEVQTIMIEHELQSVFEYPILALTDAPPQRHLQQYLICLQNAGTP